LPPLLFDSAGDGSGDFVDPLDDAADALDRGDGLAGYQLDRHDLTGDVLASLGRLIGERLHLGRYHGKPFARFPSPRRLDGRIQGKQVGLAGDILNLPDT
jgi:hypothetical protein